MGNISGQKAEKHVFQKSNLMTKIEQHTT